MRASGRGSLSPWSCSLVGWERGDLPDQAQDPQPGGSWQPVDLGPYLTALREGTAKTEPKTETERWLRSGEAWQAVSGHLLARLEQADPGNGHGIGRGQRAAA